VRYLDGYSRLAKAALENFGFEAQLDRLEAAQLLYPVLSRICDVDLRHDRVSNLEMGYLFEELIRRFAEQSNETAGEHFTPRDVVRLMVELLMAGDDDALGGRGVLRDVYDCACGTGGMLSEAEAHVRALNPRADVRLYGQELNPESYAICLSDMLVKGSDAGAIALGNSLSDDRHAGETFHYGIANPPFGVDWTKVEQAVRDEHEQQGWAGRFGPGLPRRSDGQLLFLLHLVSKMRPVEKGGGRVAIVLNGSPLFTGAAGSGESEIRRWLIESDLIEAIVGLPEQLFYNTAISTYVWVLTNRKRPERRGKVQLIDGRDLWNRMRRSLGEKRRELLDEHVDQIVALHGDFAENDRVRILANREFEYRTVTVDRPLRGHWEINASTWDGLEHDRALAKIDADLRDAIIARLSALPAARFATEIDCATALSEATAEDARDKPPLHRVPPAVLRALTARCLLRDVDDPVVMTPPRKGADPKAVADPQRRDTENVPLDEDVEEYLDREVRPFVAGAWTDDAKGRIGCEIPFSRMFHRPAEVRPIEEVRAELLALEREMRELLVEGTT
jgi:type I restriction enzyme M protein